MFDTLYELIHGGTRAEIARVKASTALYESQLKIDKQIEADRIRSSYLYNKERESLVNNEIFNKINTEHNETIQARLERLKDAQSFIANANDKLCDLEFPGYLKSYKKGDIYYQIAYVSGHYNDPIGRKCLRGRISSEDDIKLIKDLYTPIENFDKYLPGMRPFIEMNLQNTIDFYEFLPDFYQECLKRLENHAYNDKANS